MNSMISGEKSPIVLVLAFKTIYLKKFSNELLQEAKIGQYVKKKVPKYFEK